MRDGAEDAPRHMSQGAVVAVDQPWRKWCKDSRARTDTSEITMRPKRTEVEDSNQSEKWHNSVLPPDDELGRSSEWTQTLS
jgi:hypothetical protein